METNTTLRARAPLYRNLVITAIAAAVIGVAIWALPGGYSRDLSRIGKGSNVVVLVHDQSRVASIKLMENLDAVRGDYAGSVEFIVADLRAPEGQVFARAHNAGVATLLLFAPDGHYLGNVRGAHEPGVLKSMFDRAFNLPVSNE